MHTRHQELSWTLGKRQLHIPGLCKVCSYAWSSAWEELSSQPVRSPGDGLSMNRLLYGDCREQSHLQGMWASTSFFFFLPSLSQTQVASPTVLFQEARQHKVPDLQKKEGGEALLSQECCPAWHAVPTQGCRATPRPHKQAAPGWMLSRKSLCPEHNQHH